MSEKIVFETESQREAALVADRNLDPTKTAVLGPDYSRICRPTEATNKPIAFIFWTKDSLEDMNKSWDKVVSTFVSISDSCQFNTPFCM